MSSVRFSGITKSFGTVEVIRGIDLKIEAGEFVVFVGPSGSGKSTLLRMVAGLEDVSDGGISIGDEDVTYAEPSERGIAMVFQSYALYPHKSVYENIAFNLRLQKIPGAELDRRVREAAQILQLTDYLGRKPSQLSGGQRQRVAIGRAIVRKPQVFLFDEPLSNLDAALRVEMRLQIEKLHRDIGATMIYVTHDQVEAMTLADRIVAFDDGRIQQIGSPLELYRKPSNLFVAGFIGSPRMNLLPGSVQAGGMVRLADARETPVPLRRAADQPVGAHVTVGLRPEALRLDADAGSDPALNGEIVSLEQLGNISYAHIFCDGLPPVIAQLPATAAFKRGNPVTATFSAGDVHLFDDAGQVIPSEPN